MPASNKIARLVSAIYRQQMAILNRQLEPYRLGGGSYVFLLRVQENPGITQTELSRHLCIDKGTTSKMLHILEQEGLITRTPNPADKRNNNLHTTPKGEAAYQAITRQVTAPYREQMLSGLSDAERDSTVAILEKIIRNLSEYQPDSSTDGG